MPMQCSGSAEESSFDPEQWITDAAREAKMQKQAESRGASSKAKSSPRHGDDEDDRARRDMPGSSHDRQLPKPPRPRRERQPAPEAVLVTTSLREAGWVVTAAPPVLCLDCAWTIATRALEQRSVAASAIFNVPTRSSHWLCLAGDEVRAAAGAFQFLVGRYCSLPMLGRCARLRSLRQRLRLGATVARVRRAGSGHDTFWRHWGAVLEHVIEGFFCAEFVVRGPTAAQPGLSNLMCDLLGFFLVRHGITKPWSACAGSADRFGAGVCGQVRRVTQHPPVSRALPATKVALSGRTAWRVERPRAKLPARGLPGWLPSWFARAGSADRFGAGVCGAGAQGDAAPSCESSIARHQGYVAIRLRILRWNQHATVIAGRFGSGKSVALEEALRGMQGVYVHAVEDKDWKQALYKSLRMDDLGMLKEALR
eukprot:s11399_g1.t1